MRRNPMLFLIPLVATACVQPPPLTPPAPVSLHAAAAPTSVVQAASRELAADGYDIVNSDANAGVVSAARKAAPQAFGDDLVCRGAKDSMLMSMGETTLRVTVTARPATSGSDVQIATKALTSRSKMPGMFSKAADSETDCVSTGAIEKRIAAALGAS